jgi:hypothetical protein
MSHSQWGKGFSTAYFRNPLSGPGLRHNSLMESHLGIFIWFCLVVFVFGWFGQRWTQNGHKKSPAM